MENLCRSQAMGNRKPHEDQKTAGTMQSWLRDFPPAHYILKIESFSLFLDTKVENYDSLVFEAGGHKWKLCICPQGNKKIGVNDHISLYLKLVETEKLPQGWEVIANFKFFVFDHNHGKFLTIQDGEEFRRFQEFKSVWGFDRLLQLDAFKDVANGYLRDDCCIFGAEIFVLENKHEVECVSTVKNPENNTYTWIIHDFSGIKTEQIYSDAFGVGGQKWKINCYPKGSGSGRGTHVSLFLTLSDPTPDKQVYADFKLQIKDQILNKYHENTANSWFSASCKGWGFHQFRALRVLNDKSKGYVVNDTVIVEAQITMVSASKNK